MWFLVSHLDLTDGPLLWVVTVYFFKLSLKITSVRKSEPPSSVLFWDLKTPQGVVGGDCRRAWGLHKDFDFALHKTRGLGRTLIQEAGFMTLVLM